MDVEIPKIGDTISVEWGLSLCRHFQLEYLVSRIEANPAAYRPWVFDGCSGVNDARWLRRIFGPRWKTITFTCCLVHDLQYAYGRPWALKERKVVDIQFFGCLKDRARVTSRRARIMYRIVRIGGIQILGQSFSWAFASKKSVGRRA